ncbi:M23 family metallopeptidase [Kiloniella laminariae]|uniref:M23 family metallopeptidase n=1 Tax=Kiloniella laminariae TaxID=454162 RepID=UPI0012F8E215|nr:M23 family metallopeptidase [Kiloniella laminariae]
MPYLGSLARKFLFGVFWGGLCFYIPPVSADEDFKLDLPIECQIPQQCIIQNYMDVSPGSGYRDYRCGTLSYPRHKGTDFRVIDYAAYHEGVVVVAAQDGEVTRIREGEKEDLFLEEPEKVPSGREAGNAVVLRHSGGWETLYAHLRPGSITVMVGQQVKAGEKLGLVGLSGNTEFTHLHFHVTRNAKFYDPFTGVQPENCNPEGKPAGLWSAEASESLSYRETGLVETGFSSSVPVVRKLPLPEERERISYRGETERLVFWMEAWGVHPADRLTLSITDPSGKRKVDQTVLTKRQASYFRYFGLKRPQEGWLSGLYLGEVQLERLVKGSWQTIFADSRKVELP